MGSWKRSMAMPSSEAIMFCTFLHRKDDETRQIISITGIGHL